MESSQGSVFKMKRRGIFRFCRRDHNTLHQQVDDLGSSKGVIFSGNNENFIKNGEMLLRDRITLFNGRTNPIHCFSVGDLNSMNAVRSRFADGWYVMYEGVWNRKSVMVKAFCKVPKSFDEFASREIAVATQMSTHTNVHRLLGCCLHTDSPVLVYEWPQNGTLSERIFTYKEHNKEPLEWKHRLRVAWEIAHAAAYLHTAFRRPLIHRDLKPQNVYLDQDNSARLSSFGGSISIPEGKTHVEDCKMLGTLGYMAPEHSRVAESSDVYSFGILLLVLMTGKSATFELNRGHVHVLNWVKDWVKDSYADDCITDIVDPTITTNAAIVEKHIVHQLKGLLGLALKCTASDYECRPTMEDVATQIRSMITSLSNSQ